MPDFTEKSFEQALVAMKAGRSDPFDRLEIKPSVLIFVNEPATRRVRAAIRLAERQKAKSKKEK